MKTFVEKQHTGLVKKFHTLLSRYGIDNETKLDILMQYNATSSTYLSVDELIDVCSKIEGENDPVIRELDKWRKRVMGAIGGWLRAMNKVDNMGKIKAIACRASQKEQFNDIPLRQLQDIYYAFKKKQKDLQMVENMTIDELNKLTLMN